jgi:hypothetical protein
MPILTKKIESFSLNLSFLSPLQKMHSNKKSAGLIILIFKFFKFLLNKTKLIECLGRDCF